MQSTPLVRYILRDEAITRGLGDVEARILIEWLVDRADGLAEESATEETAWAELGRMCRKARAISRFVILWTNGSPRGAAQLAATERFTWPIPASAEDPGELMSRILLWESRAAHRAPA